MLNEQEVAHLFGDGKELWLRAEAFGIAYHKRYKSKSLLSTYLSYATVCAGVITAVSTIPELSAYISTVIPATITAGTATISQVINPEKTQRESWDTWKKLETFKAELASRCRGLYLATDYAEEQTVFQNFNKHLANLTETDIEVTSTHKELADDNIRSANIFPMRISTTVPSRAIEIEEEEQTVSEDISIREFTRRVINR